MSVIVSLGRKPVTLKNIREHAKAAGFKIPSNWNMADILGKQPLLVINTHEGWEITDKGIHHLKSQGIPIGTSTSIVNSADELRAHLKKIKSKETAAFVEETIKCHENGLLRSAIIVSWIGAIHVLFDYVITNKKNEFNSYAKSINAKWQNVQDVDQLGKQLSKHSIGERGFLDFIENIGIITDSGKKELINCLDRRNSCGHPTTTKITPTTVAHHIEVLINYVYEPFASI